MAVTTTSRLKLVLLTDSDDKITLSIPNPSATLNAAGASACLTALVENGDAWADPIKQGLIAEVITTTTNVLVNNS